jgi:4-hydroxy-3-polyprenylbenzoate decarboxylase
MDENQRSKRLVVGMTGATGVIYGIRLLEVMRDLGVATELIMSDWAEKNIRIETGYRLEEVREMATVTHSARNQAASVSSGSYRTDGMVIVPCSMRTLACIATGVTQNLIHRAADVVIKEQKHLVLAPRETPLNAIHLQNMLTLSRIGVSIMPPVPAFYNRPETLDDIVDHFVARVLDQFGIDSDITARWRVSTGEPPDQE